MCECLLKLLSVAPLTTILPQNSTSRAIIGDDTLRLYFYYIFMLIYANLCKLMQIRCDVIGHVTALDQSEQSKLGHKPSTQLTG